MLLSWLTAEFNDIFTKNPALCVILWFDAKEEYARLLDGGVFPPQDAGFTLLRYRLDANAGVFHGPLWLKAQIAWETRHLPPSERADLRFVLHLPFARELMDEETPQAAALECLLEYRYAGKTWLIDGKEPTLFAFLRKRGVPLPITQKEQRALWENGRDSLLAKFVAQFADKDAGFWQQPLNADKVNLLLVGGDLSQRLLDLLADPDNQVAYLQSEQRLQEFAQAVNAEYSYAVPLLPDPRAWVRDFMLRLALNECFIGYGAPDDFPFVALLPAADRRDRWLSFWKRWTSDRDLAAVYNKLIHEVEKDYNLAAWAKGRNGSSQAFAHLAQATWEDDYAAFQAVAGSRAQLDAYATSNEKHIKEAAGGYWARATEDLPGWGLLNERKLAMFLIQAQTNPGSGRIIPLGNLSTAMKEGVKMAEAYLRANLKNLGIDRNLKDYDFTLQAINLNQAREGAETAVGFFIAMVSALLERPVKDPLVVVGDMTVHGMLMKATSLTERMQMALDAGAKKMLLPSENKRDIADVPDEVLNKIQPVFYTDPINAAIRAMGLE